MKNIVFHANGFGDLLVCFKALYATKQLYPEYKLFLLISEWGGGYGVIF
ncbi:TPA: hypothetical protein RTH03_001479 [Campylobacter jejuni]|nr:hypothetical protein [Campylobacter jejuni]HDZ5086150.1 hypothetical protein [Campylobacter jejuni]HDZ5107099.1 hypothetical protein [Campylobacter jejuni]